MNMFRRILRRIIDPYWDIYEAISPPTKWLCRTCQAPRDSSSPFCSDACDLNASHATSDVPDEWQGLPDDVLDDLEIQP